MAFSSALHVTSCTSCHLRQTCFHVISSDRRLTNKYMNPETNKERMRERNIKPLGGPMPSCDEDGFLGLLQNSCRAGGIVHMLEKKKEEWKEGICMAILFMIQIGSQWIKSIKKINEKKMGMGCKC